VSLGDANMLVDISSGVMRPLVPAKFHQDIFTAVHDLAHPGPPRDKGKETANIKPLSVVQHWRQPYMCTVRPVYEQTV
jgi:hypothetical protein